MSVNIQRMLKCWMIKVSQFITSGCFLETNRSPFPPQKSSNRILIHQSNISCSAVIIWLKFATSQLQSEINSTKVNSTSISLQRLYKATSVHTPFLITSFCILLGDHFPFNMQSRQKFITSSILSKILSPVLTWKWCLGGQN